MTFAYNGMIPNPPNDPASDVGTMQTNATSIGGIIGVDHVGFNIAGGGWHKQVTLPANNIPVIDPGTMTYLQSVLFTNKAVPAPVVNLNQLFYYPAGANAAQSSSQYYNSATNGNAIQGSAILLGGIIIKWGTYTIPANAINIPITFANLGGAQPFPNGLFSISVTCTAFAVNNDILCTAINPVAGGFSGQRIGAPASTANYSFIAIGN